MNKVILIGGNHHNILGAVRSFGVNKIYPFGIFIGEGAANSFARSSKYWAQTWAIDSEENLIDFLLNHFENEKEKPVIICCSDASEKILDENYECLKGHFLLSSLQKGQGEIAQLMDKYKQVKLAEKYDIPVAQTFIVNLENIFLPKNMLYPCIVKPIISAEGKKVDICKCDTYRQTMEYLQTMKAKGYKSILLQQYLAYDAEYLMVGSIHGGKCCWFNSKKIRIWPIIGGSSCYLQISRKKYVSQFYNNIRELFKKIQYDGIFDVEAFDVNGKMYLNEINWRNSGTVYSCMGTNVHYLVVWYYWKIGKQLPKKLTLFCEDENVYSIDESLDLRYLICGKITLRRWLQDRKRAKSFAIWFRSDLKPAIIEYIYLVEKFIRRHRV